MGSSRNSTCPKKNNWIKINNNNETEQNIQEPWYNFNRYNLCTIWMSEEESENRAEEIFDVIIAENFPNINERTIDPENSKNTKEDNYKK